VPKQSADEARLSLAEKNLPLGGVVGWEIFDQTKMGATDFDRRIQLIRAISGELSRTIRRIQAVDDARVQIVIPETKLFAENVAPVTASVMIRLKPGAELTPEKIKGIIHLVASSVENLQPENVTIVDNTGRILTIKPAQPLQQIVVSQSENPIESEPISPEAKVSVLEQKLAPIVVTPEVKTPAVTKVAPTVTIPAKSFEVVAVAAVSIEAPVKPLTKEEKVLLQVKAKKELERDLSGKAQEILNRFYPPNSAIVKVDTNMINGKVKKLTAVILIDNRIDVNQNLKQATFKSVAAAVGYLAKRGDKIVVQKVPFHLATPPPETIKDVINQVIPPRKDNIITAIPIKWLKNILWIVGVLVASLLIIYLFRFWRSKSASKPINKSANLSQTIAAAPKQPYQREANPAVESIRATVEQNPEKIAQLLKEWLTK
jgi:flagellar M-ring protein FliF